MGDGGRNGTKAARLQRRGSPKFNRWNLRGQSVPGRSRGDARRPQVALHRKLTRRRGLQRRAGSGIPRLARRVGLAPQGDRCGRNLPSGHAKKWVSTLNRSDSPLALHLWVSLKATASTQPRDGWSGLPARAGPGRRSSASAAQNAAYAQLQGALPSSPALRTAQRSVVADPGAGSQQLTRKPLRWGLNGYDDGLLSLSLSWVLMASLPPWQNRHGFASH